LIIYSNSCIVYGVTPKGVFMATQLNSTRRRVEFS